MQEHRTTRARVCRDTPNPTPMATVPTLHTSHCGGARPRQRQPSTPPCWWRPQLHLCRPSTQANQQGPTGGRPAAVGSSLQNRSRASVCHTLQSAPWPRSSWPAHLAAIGSSPQPWVAPLTRSFMGDGKSPISQTRGLCGLVPQLKGRCVWCSVCPRVMCVLAWVCERGSREGGQLVGSRLCWGSGNCF